MRIQHICRMRVVFIDVDHTAVILELQIAVPDIYFIFHIVKSIFIETDGSPSGDNNMVNALPVVRYDLGVPWSHSWKSRRI